jgi:CheY-like chemotaxis protein
MSEDALIEEIIGDLKVLVVDDSSTVRNVLVNLLRSLGMKSHIDEAGDGLAAWKLIKAGEYDLVICDIRMPLMNGLELRELLRATIKFADMPFLFISGEVTEESIAAAVASEYDGFLSKPFSPARLKKEIVKLLARRMGTESQDATGRKGSSVFLHQIQNDPGFAKMAQACASDLERVALLQQEGFDLSPEELEAAILAWPAAINRTPSQKAEELRRSQRYFIFMKVTEVNGQPVRDTVLLDLSMWGAKIESLIPFRDNVELSISLPREKEEGKSRLSAQVVWCEQVPISKRYHVGMQFSEPLERLQQKGKFNLEKFWTAVGQRDEEIAKKDFADIKEFADTLGVHWFTAWRQTTEKHINFQQVKDRCKIRIPPRNS